MSWPRALAGALLPLTAASMWLVDRPLALWLNSHFYDTGIYQLCRVLLRPLDACAIAIVVLVIAQAMSGRGGKAVPAWLDRAGTAGRAAILALILAVVFKVVVGRSQVYPQFLSQHVYGFRPFGDWPSFAAFPSAAMAVSSAFVVGLQVRRTAATVAVVFPLTGIALAILLTNGHWLSDLLAGCLLGVIVGRLRAGHTRELAPLSPDHALK